MLVFVLLFAAALVAPVIWPQIDLFLSGLFYRPNQGFFLADHPFYTSLHWMAYGGARALGVFFVGLALWATFKKKKTLGLDKKAWGYLLVALIIGPVLIANVGFKDHWGRARPREVVEFGGHAPFSPALEPHFENARSNGSFVSGDGAFGFFLPAFAFVVPHKASRRVFWQMIGLGSILGGVRLAMGAHFFSDIVYAAFLMLASSGLTFAFMYGPQELRMRWQSWFKPTGP